MIRGMSIPGDQALIGLLGVSTIFASVRQIFQMFRDSSFRARGNRLIKRDVHPMMFLMNFAALSLFILIVGAFLWMLIRV